MDILPIIEKKLRKWSKYMIKKNGIITKTVSTTLVLVSLSLSACSQEYTYTEETNTKHEVNSTNKKTSIKKKEDNSDKAADAYADEGYKLVWNDEFEGDSLNLSDWNVETFEPGANNAELQRYTALEEGNIQVKDGELHIIPIYDGGTSSEEEGAIKERHFDTYTLDIDVSTDKAQSDTIAFQMNLGKIADDGQFTDNAEALSSIADVTITNLALVDITEGADQTNLLASGNFENSWDWSMVINEPAKGYSDFTNGKLNIKIENAGDADWQIQLQQWEKSLIPGHTYRFSMDAASDIDRAIEVVLLDPNNGYDWYGGGKLLINGSGNHGGYTSSNGEITSARITTQGKHDFTYGRFEARAKVPEGKGFLPAFWLLAKNDPRCAEIDVMEVMGQDTHMSYHTIHYGDTYTSGHMQSQVTNVISGAGYEDYHVFRVDWEPGLIVWYVDDDEVYRTSEWYSGTEENKLPYPAPFNQDFFILLNLAVGGSWVGYPDYEAINDFAGKEFVVDYVRVYQKDESEYKKAEENLTEAAQHQ